MLWPWSFLPCGVAPMQGTSGPSAELITIRPDAKTRNRSGPCRELNHQRTPNHCRCRSRFSECLYCHGTDLAVSFRRHFASAKLIAETQSCIGKIAWDG